MHHFYLRVIPSAETRVIVSVSKKVAKKAVTRNAIKRRVRPILRRLTPNLPRATYMFVATGGAEKVRGKELESELNSLVGSHSVARL